MADRDILVTDVIPILITENARFSTIEYWNGGYRHMHEEMTVSPFLYAEHSDVRW